MINREALADPFSQLGPPADFLSQKMLPSACDFWICTRTHAPIVSIAYSQEDCIGVFFHRRLYPHPNLVIYALMHSHARTSTRTVPRIAVPPSINDKNEKDESILQYYDPETKLGRNIILGKTFGRL